MGAIARRMARHRKASTAVLVILLASAPWVWWVTQLWGLPDIGDPFDVAAFEAVHVPDERNAFLVYVDATSMSNAGWKRFQNVHRNASRGKVPLEWAKADQPWRDHLADQRQALDLWRVGSERSDAMHEHPEGLTFHTIIDLTQRLRMLTRLAILEASRLEAEGDMAGAWGWYRAVFKSSRHAGRHGFLIERAIGAGMHKDASEPLTRWASDPRVDAPLLRRAIDDLIAIDATSTPLSDALKKEYLIFVHSLHDPSLIDDLLLQKQQDDPTDWCDDLPVSPATKKPIQAARVFLADDRERSLRVIRLMLANWLAQVDKPPNRRSKLARTEPPIYQPDPNAPAALNPLPPEDLARWLESTLLARRIYSFQARYSPHIDSERLRQGRLVVHLASELYRREHGEPPPSPQALVGPYVNALPEGFDAIADPTKTKP
jgi:hypothetical protein